MGLRCFRKNSNKNNYTNIDVVESNIRSSDLRGKTFDYFIVDEVAFTENEIYDLTNEYLDILDPINKN